NTAQDMIAAGDRNMSNLGRLLSVLGAGAGATVGPLTSMVGVIGPQAVSALRRAGLQTVDDLVADALLHPQVARTLLSKSQSRPDQGIWKVLAAHYGNAARVAAALGAERQAEARRQ
ncbi:MAG TPA: hypothetical protein PLV87_07990, partial [Opitutaceae bacterium]|nr:hypothetical protein [Opitutaceae bacterium]